MAADRSHADDTAALADALFTLMPLVANHVNERLGDLGMTTTDYWALRNIQGPMPMKELAHCMDFDPSYVTLVADRLENFGLIERRQHPTDRRIKNLVLTAKGRRLRTTIPDTLWDGPNTFSSLTDAERRQLKGLVVKLIASRSDGGSSAAS